MRQLGFGIHVVSTEKHLFKYLYISVSKYKRELTWKKVVQRSFSGCFGNALKYAWKQRGFWVLDLMSWGQYNMNKGIDSVLKLFLNLI